MNSHLKWKNGLLLSVSHMSECRVLNRHGSEQAHSKIRINLNSLLWTMFERSAALKCQKYMAQSNRLNVRILHTKNSLQVQLLEPLYSRDVWTANTTVRSQCLCVCVYTAHIVSAINKLIRFYHVRQEQFQHSALPLLHQLRQMLLLAI